MPHLIPNATQAICWCVDITIYLFVSWFALVGFVLKVASKHFKGGKESKIDLLVMENLLFRRSITRLYDLKGSSRSRYNADTSGSNKVLLDQNLIEAMPTSPIFVGSKAKRLLERAVWNDTAFLAVSWNSLLILIKLWAYFLMLIFLMRSEMGT